MDENQTPTTPKPLPETNEEKLQELSIILGDRLRSVSKIWWYVLLAVFILSFPLYYGLRSTFASIIYSNHKFPAYIYQAQTKVPLEVTDAQVFKLTDNSFAGFVKIKNSANLEWGIINQPYTAVFTTTGGTEVTKISSSTFILPSSTKIIVFPRFTSTTGEPTKVSVTLGATQFTRPPDNVSTPKLSVQSADMSVVGGQLTVNASVHNDTPFTISRVDLPVLVYDSHNNIVAVNYTYINDLKYQETRSFQFTWPNSPAGAFRAEVLPEANIFDPNIYQLAPGTSQFDSNSSEGN